MGLGSGLAELVPAKAVEWQEEEPCTAFFESRLGLFASVAQSIVEGGHVSALERQGQLDFPIGFIGLPVHWTVNDPRDDQSVMAQSGDFILSHFPRRAHPRNRVILAVVQILSIRSAFPGTSSSKTGGMSAI